MEEGRLVCFLLATSGVLYLREAIQSGCKVPQVHFLPCFGLRCECISLMKVIFRAYSMVDENFVVSVIVRILPLGRQHQTSPPRDIL